MIRRHDRPAIQPTPGPATVPDAVTGWDRDAAVRDE